MTGKIYLISIAIAFTWCAGAANAQVSPGSNSHSFNYVAGVLTPTQKITLPVANAFNSFAPPKFYSLSVTTQATGFSVQLEGSLDNSTWTRIAITNAANGMISNVNPMPALYLRINATTIAANTAVTATALGQF